MKEILIIESSNKVKKLKIYPNPVTYVLNIRTPELLISVELYDDLGRKLKNLNPSPKNNVSYLSPGVYILKIKTDKEN